MVCFGLCGHVDGEIYHSHLNDMKSTLGSKHGGQSGDSCPFPNLGIFWDEFNADHFLHHCDFEAATSSRICFPQQEGSSAGASYLSAELVYARPHFALSSKETLRHICVYQNGW